MLVFIVPRMYADSWPLATSICVTSPEDVSWFLDVLDRGREIVVLVADPSIRSTWSHGHLAQKAEGEGSWLGGQGLIEYEQPTRISREVSHLQLRSLTCYFKADVLPSRLKLETEMFQLARSILQTSNMTLAL